MGMHTIAIGEAIRVGWHKFWERPWYLLGLSLVFGLLFVVASNNAMMSALGAIVYSGYLALLLKHYRTGGVVFDDLFSTIDARWIYLAFAIVIKSFLILLGFLLFIVPGIYLALRFSFVELLIIDKGLKPIEALRASTALTQGHKWRLFGFTLLALVLILLGLVVFVVGAVAMSAVVTFAYIHIYEKLGAVPQS